MSNRDDSSGDRNEAHEDEESGVDSGRDSSPDSSEPSRPSEEERPRRTKAKGKRDRESVKAPAKPSGGSQLVLAAVVALAVGGAAGWFGHEAQAKAKARALDSAPAPAGSGAATGACATWEKKLCASTGDQSAACGQAKSATGLLTPSVCEVALAGIPATLAKVKAERAPCDKLVAKLCGDLPPGSQACNLVKERTPSFPADRCVQMHEHYDDVLGQLKQLDQQGIPGMQPGMPPGAAPHGMPPGASPPGMPPGASPHTGAPQAAAHP